MYIRSAIKEYGVLPIQFKKKERFCREGEAFSLLLFIIISFFFIAVSCQVTTQELCSGKYKVS